MIPISVASPIKQVRPVFQISGTEKKKNMMVVLVVAVGLTKILFTRYQTAALDRIVVFRLPSLTPN
jgi:hypothetical protein